MFPGAASAICRRLAPRSMLLTEPRKVARSIVTGHSNVRGWNGANHDHSRQMSSSRKESMSDVEWLSLSEDESEPRRTRNTILLGLVCYDPAVPSIWKGMMRHFARAGLDVDFVTFTSYERLVEALMKRYVDIAWNGPLAHARCVRFTNGKVLSLGMRDVDRDFKTHIIVRNDSGVFGTSDLNGANIATGTVDSPQAYIMPLWALQQSGQVDLKSLVVTRYDRDIGKHGDTAIGEDGALGALVDGTSQAAFISDLMWNRYVASGKTKGLRILDTFSVPPFDHCQFTALDDTKNKVSGFTAALLAMNTDRHRENARTMQLEGIRKEWMPPRGGPEAGYEAMIAALNAWDEKRLIWPGVLHTLQRHPFKKLHVDYRLVRDNNGC